jgi:hypothetical protein
MEAWALCFVLIVVILLIWIFLVPLYFPPEFEPEESLKKLEVLMPRLEAAAASPKSDRRTQDIFLIADEIIFLLPPGITSFHVYGVTAHRPGKRGGHKADLQYVQNWMKGEQRKQQRKKKK